MDPFETKFASNATYIEFIRDEDLDELKAIIEEMWDNNDNLGRLPLVNSSWKEEPPGYVGWSEGAKRLWRPFGTSEKWIVLSFDPGHDSWTLIFVDDASMPSPMHNLVYKKLYRDQYEF